MNENEIEVDINGNLIVPDSLTLDTVESMFIAWVNSQGWEFSGRIGPSTYEDDSNPLGLKDLNK